MTERILILDFGSQYTQLIARAVREANVYCEIIPYHQTFSFEPGLKGIILSGSPFSVNDKKSLNGIIPDSRLPTPDFPLYGLQFHLEVYHSIEGKKILHNFLVNVCRCSQDWTPAHFITDAVAELKKLIGKRKVVMALSVGV